MSVLLRFHAGEHKVWSVVKVPDLAEEARERSVPSARLPRDGFM